MNKSHLVSKCYKNYRSLAPTWHVKFVRLKLISLGLKVEWKMTSVTESLCWWRDDGCRDVSRIITQSRMLHTLDTILTFIKMMNSTFLHFFFAFILIKMRRLCEVKLNNHVPCCAISPWRRKWKGKAFTSKEIMSFAFIAYACKIIRDISSS